MINGLLASQLLFFPSLIWNLLLCRVLRVGDWWNEIDEHLLLGAMPLASDARRLASEGVQVVVNTCAEYRGPLREYERLGMEQFHLPLIDRRTPSVDELSKAVGFIEERVGSGQKVYVHCRAGKGRSATITLCWMMKRLNLNPEEAYRRLLSVRRQINRNLAEKMSVRTFYEELREDPAE